MSHLDDDSVASLAVGDDQDSAAVQHAAECADCEYRVGHMRALADRIGALGRHSRLLTPANHVWDQITRELGDELFADVPDAGDDVSQASADATYGSPVDLASRRAAGFDAATSAGDRRESTRETRRTPWLVGIAAGIIGLVAGAGIVASVLSNPEPSGDVVAQAALTDLQTEAAAGTARVERLGNGSEVLVLNTDFQEVSDAYLEVWLIDSSIEGMVSLGHLTQAHEKFVIPAGFDVSAFPIVDISVEPLDGVPTHSGDSVTRGLLES